MSDRVFHDDEARTRVLQGAEILYNAVKTTMGPKGRNVVINKGYPVITHDGVTVAKGLNLPDTEETLGQRTGAELIKRAASKMNDIAGDGTTTVTVLTYHILKEANKLIAAGHNPMVLRRELEAASDEVIKQIKGQDISTNLDRLKDVAYISCADRELGDMIATVIDEIGMDGVVTVEETPELETKSEVVEGFTVDRGFASPYFANDPSRGEAEMLNPGVLVVSGKLYAMEDMMPVLDKMIRAGKKELVLVVEEVSPEIVANLVLNKAKGIFGSIVITIPAYLSYLLRDIAAVTGATLFGKETGVALSSFEAEQLGSAKKVISNKDKTTIIGGTGDTAELATELKALIKKSTDFEKRIYQKRLAALTGKVAIIHVGGASETEVEEKRFRVDDAVAAVKASLEDGIVPGGGATLLAIAENMQPTTEGQSILQNALEQPFRVLMDNAGYRADTYIDKLDANHGVNVRTGQVVDLFDAGIIDPAAVTKKAVQTATSIAGTAMTIGALIEQLPEVRHEAA
jgi:chaperonin GroEL